MILLAELNWTQSRVRCNSGQTPRVARCHQWLIQVSVTTV